MEWERDLAARVRRIIESRNAGGYPRTYFEWVGVAEKLGLNVVRVRSQMSFGACLIDDLIAVNARHDDEKLCRWIAHEIAESILRSDRGHPICLPPDSHDQYHRIACLVEEGAGMDR